MARLRILIWHIHGSYLNALGRIEHDWYLPTKAGRPEGYGGRGRTFDLPEWVREIPAEQVRDLVQVVFHEFVSMSIQHLMHEMGQRVLARFPQLAVVSFEGQNRLWDTAAVSDDDRKVIVYCDPRPPYGSIGLTLTRE